MSRSTKGCWTCRMRHKKCDESFPACQECEGRHLYCHGYGPKPAWMDGKYKERTEHSRIKDAVRQNLRRLRGMQSDIAHISDRNSLDNQSHVAGDQLPFHHIKDSQTLQGRSRTTPTPSRITEALPVLTVSESLRINPDEARQGSGGILESAGSPNTPSLVKDGSSPSLNPEVITYQEADSLMHYLDHVFQLQFPYHCISPRQGRGWLFWLLLKNKPLCQAALSLSALHQYIILASHIDDKYSELNGRHARALQELQQFLKHSEVNICSQKEHLVEILACGTTLISFEVFRGGTSDWQLHLNALSSIITTTGTPHVAAKPIGPQPVDVSSEEAGAKNQNWVDTAYAFLAAVVLWFELLASTSTGSEPRLPYKAWLCDDGLEMSAVMGCQNWAMVAIGDVASLGAWKSAASRSGRLSMRELVARGQVIEERLEREIGALRLIKESHSELGSCSVTRVFALAALVQLHTTVSGSYPGLPEVRSAVARLVVAVDKVAKEESVRGVVWPICVSGCMAEPCHQPFFEGLISNALVDSHQDFGNLGTALRILRKSWTEQAVNPTKECNWGKAMADLGICALLI